MRSLGVLRAFSMSASRSAKDDLISGLYLKQIRDLSAKQKAAGGSLVNTSPELKKQLDEQLNRLAQKFKIANTEMVAKLAVEFQHPKIGSSVNAITEGKSLSDLLHEVQATQAEYLKAREAKQRADKERQAVASA